MILNQSELQDQLNKHIKKYLFFQIYFSGLLDSAWTVENHMMSGGEEEVAMSENCPSEVLLYYSILLLHCFWQRPARVGRQI